MNARQIFVDYTFGPEQIESLDAFPAGVLYKAHQALRKAKSVSDPYRYAYKICEKEHGTSMRMKLNDAPQTEGVVVKKERKTAQQRIDEMDADDRRRLFEDDWESLENIEKQLLYNLRRQESHDSNYQSSLLLKIESRIPTFSAEKSPVKTEHISRQLPVPTHALEDWALRYISEPDFQTRLHNNPVAYLLLKNHILQRKAPNLTEVKTSLKQEGPISIPNDNVAYNQSS